MSSPDFPRVASRRDFLRRASGGFGAVALAGMLTERALADRKALGKIIVTIG